jgi:transposase
MNSVGIDISKGKSMLAALRPFGEVTISPKEFEHTKIGLENLKSEISLLQGEVRVIMEATGRYHEPVVAALNEAGFFVTVVNPILIHGYGNNSVRRVKTDKKDAVKIAKYGLDNWVELRKYSDVDVVRQQLKLFSRQYGVYSKAVVSLQNNLISLLDRTFSGINQIFKSPVKPDGSQKWVDFVSNFYHCDCVRNESLSEFSSKYQKWCKKNRYQFLLKKSEEIYEFSQNIFATLPKNLVTKSLIMNAVKQLKSANETLAKFKIEFIKLAKQLPEYDFVCQMFGVGEITGAGLLAEIGDVRRFNNRGALIAFAGIDPGINQSGKYNAKSVKTSKRGSSHLRKILFQIVTAYNVRSPENEPVYQFLDRKRAEGKPYYVYMTASENKFLRIFYAKTKEFLDNLDCKS